VDMENSALSKLEKNDKGFFLMVEGASIDKSGHPYVTNKDELANSQSDQVLGLFSEKDMPLQIDAPQSNPLLVDMENSALSKLEKNDKGFFLMVEGASIDKSGHP
ncbi:hypothetical protein EF900_19720, partial [Staphylococcus aureus]